MLLYVTDTYNYDRGAFCHCQEAMVAETAELRTQGHHAEDDMRRQH